MVIVNFIRDSDVGIWARIKRESRQKTSGPPKIELDGGCADVDEDGRPSSSEPGVDGVRRRK